MKNKCTLIFLIALLFGVSAFGQSDATVTLATVQGVPNTPVVVPLTVTNFINVSAITLRIHFKKGVLNFINLTNKFPGFTPTVGSTDTTVSIVWSSVTPINITSGTLADLNFLYHGTSTALTFYSCQVSTYGPPPQNLIVTYTNGAVNPDQNLPNHAQIGTKLASYGATVSVPLYYPVFTEDAGSLTQYISYDVTKLTFSGITPKGDFVGALGNATGGVVKIEWTDIDGKDISSPGDTILINFTYIGNTAAPLTFYPGCVITDPTGGNIPVSYFDGAVNPAPPSGTATLGILSSCQGQEVEVPLDFSGFPPNITAFTLNVDFPSTKLAYLQTTVLNPSGSIVINRTGSTIHVAWTNAGGDNINGTFLRFKFKYIGITQAPVTFGAGCSFTAFPSDPVNVLYNNGRVNPTIPDGNNALIGFATAISGNEVLVPISFADLPTNIGAVTLFATIDPSKLVYINCASNPFGAIVNSTGTTVGISWANAEATDVNGTFVVLRFMYTCGSADCKAPIEFTDGSEIANISQQILCMDWHNGGVNMMFKVTGTLRYDNDTDPLALAGVKVYIKDGPEPVPPATTPVPNKIDSTVTDITGHFELSVLNGSYWLYAASTTAWGGVGSSDVINIRYYIAGYANSIGTNPLRMRAADLNQNGSIESGDVIVLRYRLANITPNPNYKAPDWLFGNPNVIVSGADNPGNDFKGICSGDVNGSYPVAY